MAGRQMVFTAGVPELRYDSLLQSITFGGLACQDASFLDGVGDMGPNSCSLQLLIPVASQVSPLLRIVATLRLGTVQLILSQHPQLKSHFPGNEEPGHCGWSLEYVQPIWPPDKGCFRAADDICSV